MHQPFSTRVTGHNRVTYARDSITIFLIHFCWSKLSLQLTNALQFCLSVHPSHVLFPFGIQQQKRQSTTETPLAHTPLWYTCAPYVERYATPLRD